MTAACGGSVAVPGTGTDGAGGVGASAPTGDAAPPGRRVEATDQLDPASITADDSALYWTNRGTNVDNEFPFSDGSVMKLPFAGGVPQILAQGGSPEEIALDDTYVYWSDGQKVQRVAKTGGAPEATVVSDYTIYRLVVDASSVYFVAAAGWIQRAPKQGGVPEIIVGDDAVSPRQLAIDDTHLYWADHGIPGDTAAVGFVARLPKTGGVVTKIATGQVEAWAVTVDDAAVYWSVFGPESQTAKNGAVLYAPKDGGAPSIIAGGQRYVYDLVVDGSRLYWGNYSLGPIMRADLKSGAADVLWDDDTAGDVALGPTRLYWIDPYSDDHHGSILSVER